MNIRYRAPEGVHPIIQGQRVLLSTSQGGQVLVDSRVLGIWEKACQNDLDSLLSAQPPSRHREVALRVALGCLCQAGLLERISVPQAATVTPTTTGPLVSAVIVSYNSRSWLESCLASLNEQCYQPIEIILVDNHSSDDTVSWLNTNHPELHLIQLSRSESLAYAINSGVDAAQGTYFLILNPDVRLEPNTVAELVKTAEGQQNCAVVAAKIRLMWTPGFLNGLGNLVGAFSFGVDIGLGHLDLGQFDHQEQLPSACFAAALVTRAAWQKVGPIDPAFLLYYEDTEWCYRARICGFSVLAAPDAIVYHAFGSRSTNQKGMELSPLRLERNVYGRLRFASKLLETSYRRRFILRYLIEDTLRLCLALLRLRRSEIRAIWQGWKIFQQAAKIRQDRHALQACRRVNDEALFEIQKDLPPPLIWRGVPLLTLDTILSVYLPVIQSWKAVRLPEFADIETMPRLPPRNRFQRIQQIIRLEGLPMLFHRLQRAIQWFLAQP